MNSFQAAHCLYYIRECYKSEEENQTSEGILITMVYNQIFIEEVCTRIHVS